MKKYFMLLCLTIILTGCALITRDQSSKRVLESPHQPTRQHQPQAHKAVKKPGKPVYVSRLEYALPKSAQGKQCVNQCQENQLACERSCYSDKKRCISMTVKRAKTDFKAYQAKQRKAGKQIIHTFDDFYHPQACEQPCGCEVEYHSCFQLCGGEIKKRQHCIENCL